MSPPKSPASTSGVNTPSGPSTSPLGVDLLPAAEIILEEIARIRHLPRFRLNSPDQIYRRVGREDSHRTLERQYLFSNSDDILSSARCQADITTEIPLDGVYTVCTSTLAIHSDEDLYA